MTATSLAESNRLDDTDSNPPKRVKHITLQAAIAYAEQNGYRWFFFGQCYYRKVDGKWKGSVRNA